MELENEFVVPRPAGQAWGVLTDVERIAPCLPGAQLREVEGDLYRGVVKVKVGPIVAQFAGQARFVELDETGHRAVLEAKGKEATGKGLAQAMVTATLHPEGEGSTRVKVHTDLTISGRIAQFGRGTLADVSAKLLRQFAERLEEMLRNEEPEATAGTAAGEPGTPEPAAEPATTPGTPAAGDTPTPTPTAPDGDTAVSEPQAAAAPAPQVRVIDSPEAEPVDLLRSAGAPVLKRLVPAVVLLAVVVVVVVLLVR